jgi:hypothetical protein
MLGTSPTSGPTPITSLGFPSDGEKKNLAGGMNRKELLSLWPVSAVLARAEVVRVVRCCEHAHSCLAEAPPPGAVFIIN